MPSEKDKEGQAWLAIASAAIAGYQPPEDEEFETFEELVDDMVEVATGVADNLVNEYMARYGKGGKAAAKPSRKPSRRRRGRGADEEE